MSITNNIIKYIRGFIRTENNLERYLDVLWENQCELIYHTYARLEEELEIIRHNWIIDFIKNYSTYKKLEPEDIFKAGQESILWELRDIYEAVKTAKKET